MITLASSIRMKKVWAGAVGGAALFLAASSAQAALSNFQADVATAIDRGLNWFSVNGAFNNPSAAGDAAGLVMEALLEKRPSGIPTDPPQGYNNSSPVDQGRLRALATYIINQTNLEGPANFYAYRDGARLFALAEYAVTGGPDKSVLGTTITIKQAVDMLVDRTVARQRKAPAFPAAINQGYWCYNDANCEDSSTTQFAAAGLNAAKVFYTSGKFGDPANTGPFNDAARTAQINTALALTKTAYELNALNGSDYGTTVNANCQVMNATERGHGYNAKSWRPSLAQTASGVYIQQFGGSDVNTPMVQNYMQWLKNRYRYTDLDSLGNSWPTLTWSYYMWSSFKAMELIRQSGVIRAIGNIGPDDMGTLPVGTAAAGDCAVRETNKDPAPLTRVASFGAGGAGYYAAEPKNQYFDYAHQILSYQCPAGSGFFGCNGAPGYWDQWSHQAYQLLVLLRATGNAIQKCDVNGDGRIDALDINLIRSGIGSVPVPNDVRDANNDGRLTMVDVRQCTLVCSSANCALAP
jgi:hypothetical protein